MGVRTGVDLVSIDRIRRAARSPRFLERVFTPGELDWCMERPDPARHLAGRFAAKEALYKALSGAYPGPLGWKDMEVVSAPGAPPRPAVRGGHVDAFVSIAYARGHAFALALFDPGRQAPVKGKKI